jgi:hypothetical protein
MFSWIMFLFVGEKFPNFFNFFLGWPLMCSDVKDENLNFLIYKVVYYKGISTITPIERYKLLLIWWNININNLLNLLLIMITLTILFTMTIRSLQNSVTHLGHFPKDFLPFTTFITLNLLLIAFQCHVPRASKLCWILGYNNLAICERLTLTWVVECVITFKFWAQITNNLELGFGGFHMWFQA